MYMQFIHSLKPTANASEHRPGQPKGKFNQIHQFSGTNFREGRVFLSNIHPLWVQWFSFGKAQGTSKEDRKLRPVEALDARSHSVGTWLTPSNTWWWEVTEVAPPQEVEEKPGGLCFFFAHKQKNACEIKTYQIPKKVSKWLVVFLLSKDSTRGYYFGGIGSRYVTRHLLVLPVFQH